MRVIFFIIGILALCAGVLGVVMSLMDSEFLWVGRIGGIAFVASGLILIIAAMKKYRGHWSFVIGIALISAAFFGLGSELDDKYAGQSSKLAEAFILLVGLIIVGILSLWSAHKLHRCAVALEDRNDVP
jgi:hypothetical protein